MGKRRASEERSDVSVRARFITLFRVSKKDAVGDGAIYSHRFEVWREAEVRHVHDVLLRHKTDIALDLNRERMISSGYDIVKKSESHMGEIAIDTTVRRQCEERRAPAIPHKLPQRQRHPNMRQ
jgi:hypothetical protein